MLADGKSTKDISSELSRTEKTVKKYISDMMEWNACPTTPNLVAEFLRNKIVK